LNTATHSPKKDIILILGASGFIGNAIYKELSPYFKVYGTYAHQEEKYINNHAFYKYKVEEQRLKDILNTVKPSVIISAFRGDFNAQYKAHKLLKDYCSHTLARILFLSSVKVFDGKGEFPSYESDRTHAKSEYGKFKISIEKLLCKLPKQKHGILRLPLILGANSPKILLLKRSIKYRVPFEVYPNLVVGAITINKIAQQVHYIINKKNTGIFHLSSNDMVHHDELFKEISKKISPVLPIFTNVYSSNNDRYLALIPRENTLPKQYNITIAGVIESCSFKNKISL